MANIGEFVNIQSNKQSAGNGFFGAQRGVYILNSGHILCSNNDVRNQTLSGIDVRGSRFNYISCNIVTRNALNNNAFSAELLSVLSSNNVMNTLGQVVKTLQVQAGVNQLEVQNVQLPAGAYKLIVYEKDIPSAQATLNIAE
jgi:galactitol-specific phosphotransferase system IIB component